MTNTMLMLQKKLEYFAACCDCRCRWKFYSDLVLPEPELPSLFGYHDCDFCRKVKTEYGSESRCIRNDAFELADHLKNHGGAVTKRCHAGACEIIVPVTPINDHPLGVIQVGPFRFADSILSYPGTGREFAGLPVFSKQKCEAIIDFIPQLFTETVRRAYFEDCHILPQCPEDERIKKVVQLIQLNWQHSPDIDSCANAVFMSKSRLIHLFKEECGIPVTDFILKLKLREARRYLLGSDLPLSRIAAMTGFANQSHFGAMFKREYGVSPLKYRNLAAKPDRY